MTPDYQSTQTSTAKIIGREVLAHAATLLLYPFAGTRQPQPTPRMAEQRTVVFIHGYLGHRTMFLPLRTYLRAHGIHRTLNFSYSPSAGIEHSARELQRFLRKHVRGGRIDLVCHSLGGVIARVYLQDLGGARRVDRCLTLGTPHYGTYSAYWLPTRIGHQMRPDSSLLTRLNRGSAQSSRVAFTYFVAASDNIVVPRIFAERGADVVVVNQVGHVGMLYSRTMFRGVLRRLQAT